MVNMANLRLEIVNVVISTWADKLSIEKLARSLPKSIYEPDTFAGLIYHRQVPKATIIMFSSGRMVSTGTKSVKQGEESLHVTLDEISKIMKKDLKMRDTNTENIVIKADLQNNINLKKMARIYKNSKYNPDSFPALIYVDKPNPSCLVFANGKIISAGSKNEAQARKSIKNINTKIKTGGCYTN